MVSKHAGSLLQLTADLELRDAAVAVEIAQFAELAGRAEAVGERATELEELLARVPGELAAADRAEAEQDDRCREAHAELVVAEAHVAKLEHDRRASDDARARVGRELSYARELAVEAAAGAERIRQLHADLAVAESAGRAEIAVLVAQAEEIADRLAALTRVSESGRSRPEPTLPGLVEWAARVHAALLIVRSQLDAERDRLVREANELGSSVLGEPLGGQSVDLVGRRVRAALRG